MDGTCPDEAALDAFVGGRLHGDALATLEAHLAACATCREVVAVTVSAPPAPAGALTRGVAMGRYLVLDVLGAGAMGAVYVAYDPDLDRKVALKLVRARVDDDGARERLLREAKAMARVKHPNVVAVFDAGVHGDQVFIAMELVDGGSLTAWLATRRAPAAIVDAFVAAGRGLAAAHAAGVVHRDFKPDNVLVGADGRVYVTDFGLARADTPSEPGAALARTSLAGTPAYMAPEQLNGDRADARSDQFAFCVALAEGLTGRRPFAAANLDALRVALSREPDLTGVPAPIRRALARGLAVDPARRYPTLEPLLDDLAAWGRPPVRALAFAGVGLAAAVALGAWAMSEPSCGARATAEADAVWAPHAADVRAAFTATGSPLAERAWEGVDRVIGGHLADYRVARIATCEARALPDDPRVTCLADRRRELDALVGLFAKADADVVREATLAAHGVLPIALCGDLESARATASLQVTSPEAVAVADQLAEAKVQRDAGRFEPALAIARDTVTRAATLPDPRFDLRARLLEGELRMELGAYDDAVTLQRAVYLAATAARDDETAARALLDLMRLHGDFLRQLDDALAWSDHADAVLSRLDDPPLLRARWHYTRGIIEVNGSRHDEAIAAFERAVALDSEVLGVDHLQVATDRAGLGSALTLVGRFDEALVHQEAALAATEAALGPDHPRVANRLINLAITLGRSGRGAEGLPYLERAVPIARDALGADHPTTLLAQGVLGTVYTEVEDYGKARRILEDAARTIEAGDLWNPNLEYVFSNLALARRYTGDLDGAAASLDLAARCVGDGSERPQTEAIRLAIAGDIALARGDAAGALALYERADGIRRAHALGEIEYAESAIAFGRAKRALGLLDPSAADLRTARDLYTAIYGPDGVLVGSALVDLGDTERLRGGPAAEAYTEAIRVGEAVGSVEDLARGYFGLAQVTADPAESRRLAERARDVYATRDCFGPQRDEVIAWLEAR